MLAAVSLRDDPERLSSFFRWNPSVDGFGGYSSSLAGAHHHSALSFRREKCHDTVLSVYTSNSVVAAWRLIRCLDGV